MIVRLLVWLVIGILCFPGSSSAQESPTPTTDVAQCQVGELCTNVNTEIVPERDSGPINDPPGDYVTSLLSLAFIALVVGTYLFVALTGRGFSGLFKMFGRRA